MGECKCYKLGFHAWRTLGAILLNEIWRYERTNTACFYLHGAPGPIKVRDRVMMAVGIWNKWRVGSSGKQKAMMVAMVTDDRSPCKKESPTKAPS